MFASLRSPYFHHYRPVLTVIITPSLLSLSPRPYCHYHPVVTASITPSFAANTTLSIVENARFHSCPTKKLFPFENATPYRKKITTVKQCRVSYRQNLPYYYSKIRFHTVKNVPYHSFQKYRPIPAPRKKNHRVPRQLLRA